jgi:hypothetical protein
MTAKSSKGLTNNRITVSDEYYADQKLKIGGILYLEKTFGKGFEEIAKDVKGVMGDTKQVSAMVEILSPFIVALMRQCHPHVEPEQLQEAIYQLELDEFTQLFDKLEIFSDDTEKNSQGPTAGTKRQRQPVTRKQSRGRKSSSG